MDLIGRAGHRLVKQGKDQAIACPVHAGEDMPSLVVKKNVVHCFGCCAGGSVIDWIMKTEGVSFRRAAEQLRQDVGQLSLAASGEGRSTRPAKQASTRKLEAPITDAAGDQAALRQVIDYYHETLKQSAEALAYLDKRGLDDPALIEPFQLGYSNGTLGYRLRDPQGGGAAGSAAAAGTPAGLGARALQRLAGGAGDQRGLRRDHRRRWT